MALPSSAVRGALRGPRVRHAGTLGVRSELNMGFLSEVWRAGGGPPPGRVMWEKQRVGLMRLRWATGLGDEPPEPGGETLNREHDHEHAEQQGEELVLVDACGARQHVADAAAADDAEHRR